MCTRTISRDWIFFNVKNWCLKKAWDYYFFKKIKYKKINSIRVNISNLLYMLWDQNNLIKKQIKSQSSFKKNIILNNEIIKKNKKLKKKQKQYQPAITF
jgi:hypothetical protein